MTALKKVFKPGNLKKYTLVAFSAMTLLGTPQIAKAQEKVDAKVTAFDIKKASPRHQQLYSAIVDVLSVKYPSEEAAYRASKIMTDATQFNEAQSNTYIRFMVENFMGAEYKDSMTEAKQKTDSLNNAGSKGRGDVETKISQTPDGKVTKTVTKDKRGTEVKTVEIGDGVTTTRVASEKTFKITDLTPEELQDYNTMRAKIRVSNGLRGQSDIGTMAMAQSAFMSSEREKLFELAVAGVEFKDIDEASFVAYDPETGKGQIWASQDKMSEIRKQIKKAGGLSEFMSKAKTSKSPTKAKKTTTKIPLQAIDGRIH